MKQIVKINSHTQYFIETFRQGYYSILCNRFQVNCYYIFVYSYRALHTNGFVDVIFSV